MTNPVEKYLQQIENALKLGDSTEHTHRPFLKELIESLRDDIIATNEPKRKGGNAPDFVVLESKVPIGYVEAKDVGKRLGAVEQSEQLKRYRESLNNLILTDYLEFRWYEHGELRDSMKLASALPDGTVMRCFDGDNLLINIFRQFFDSKVPSVTTAQDLAERMASRAKLLEKSVEGLLTRDTSPSLKGLKSAFRKELLPHLDEAGFADLYAQTVAYGLFTARVFTHNPPFNRQVAFANLPGTNPFLKRMFQQIAGFDLEDEPHVWAVDNIAKLLDRADMSSILEDFGKGPRKDDPVVHFYETFLREYDPELRELRGVYYTPTPVVSYIVRSVDAILKRDFGLTDGLADASKIEGTDGHKVLILDPATGTGTFLYKVIDLLYERYAKEPALWKEYVAKHLLPRVFGFELLVAPYSIAHLKLGMLLSEKHYEFSSGERLNIFLTNSLDEMDRLAETKTAGLDYWIHEEAYKAQQVKQDYPVMVVLGNPPYSGHSANTGEWMNKLLRGTDTHTGQTTESYFQVDGQPLGERNPKWLNNDYVKFIRFAQWRIEQTGEGILSFITSNSYLDSPTFRGMRESLMKGFDEIYILDLHGNSKKKERAPDGGPDQNVFDITEGVAIGIFVKKRTEFRLLAENLDEINKPLAKVYHFDLYGNREVFGREDDGFERPVVGGKYKYLRDNDVTTTNWMEITPSTPTYFFVKKSFQNQTEYEQGIRIVDLFPLNSMGVTTGADSERVAFHHQDFLDSVPPDVLREYSYRPFDKRVVRYDPKLLARARVALTGHLAQAANLALVTLRSRRNHLAGNFFVSRGIGDKALISSLDNAYFFPLYEYPQSHEKNVAGTPRFPNLGQDAIEAVQRRTGYAFFQEGRGDLEDTVGPEDILDYAYAVFYSNHYRSDYSEFLKIDFPRLPITSSPKLFRRLVSLGDQLVKIHLLEDELSETALYPAEGDNKVEVVKFEESEDGRGRVWINAQQYFEGVPTDVWNFHIGGYQVCEKWLKDRRGRTLNFDDIIHYKKIISALSETIRIMTEIDEVIEEHGGFPFK